jgi:hypothetical protein
MPTASPQHHDLLGYEALSLTVARLRLQIAPEYPRPRADHLRAAVASLKPEIDLLHQYGSDGLIYRYPRVLYRISGGEPMIVAVEDGVEALSSLNLVGADLRLGASTRRVLAANLDVRKQRLGPCSSPSRYRFTSPWLALNQENHVRFGQMTSEERLRFLDAQIANNCLSLAKSFGLRITTRLAGRAQVRPVCVRMKEIVMIGHVGEIEVNFSIPEGLALGKSVAKGFGATEAVK